MPFLTDLLGGGPNHAVAMAAGGASICPAGAGDAALDAFQAVVAQIDEHDGEGYDIYIRHETSERGSGLVDLILIALAGEDD